jgi:uncharacterized protein YjbI with pentapeptide repeats
MKDRPVDSRLLIAEHPPAEAIDEGTEADPADFAKQATDLQALRDAVVDAASVGGGLWLSYLFVFFYFAIAAGGVTHRDLLFENPVKLPFLNIDLPLIGFFVIGPPLFVIVHAYTLLHFTLLAGKVRDFDAALRQQIGDPVTQARLRRQLPINIFVQFLAGPREARTGGIGWLLRLIAWISLIAGPILLLVFFQLQFLPYHSEVISWWQRFIVVADIVLLWVLWPWADFRRGKVVACLAASFVPVLLVFTVATFPGEWLDEHVGSVKIMPAEWPPWKSPIPRPDDVPALQISRWTSLHQLLFAGEVDLATGKRMSLWSNTLVLPNIDVIDHTKFDTEAKIAALPHTLSLRGRQLEGAVFIFADLRKVDFTAARLRDAVLSGADLRNSKFECSRRAGTQLECPDLRGAVLFGANLQGVSLDGAQLTRAVLPRAQMQGASLRKAQLQGAWLQGARLEGASLDEALLWGAHFENPPPMFQYDLAQLSASPTSAEALSLTSAQLQGASLNGAQLQGALLNFAQLQGASLNGAQLQGASLVNTQLQAASLNGAQLQGASLVNTQLQGASLGGAQLQGAALINIFTWRADATESNGEGTLVSKPENQPKYHMLGCAFEPWGCEWSPGAFTDLKRLIERQVPEGDRRDKALNRIEILDPAKRPLGEQEEEKVWTDLVRSSPSRDVFTKALAVRLQEMGCDANLGPYVVSGFLLDPSSARLPTGSPEWTALADAFLDEAHCPAARALAGADRTSLQVLRSHAAKLQQVMAQVATCWSAEYSAPEADPIRAHAPYDPTEATPEQLADPSFATDAEIAAIKAISARVNECTQHFLDQLSTVSPFLVPKVSANYGIIAEHGTLLTDRKINWGEYNTKRRATAIEPQSQK